MNSRDQPVGLVAGLATGRGSLDTAPSVYSPPHLDTPSPPPVPDRSPITVSLLIPTLDRSGAEKQLVTLACGLPREEFRVEVIALTRGGPLEATLDDLRETIHAHPTFPEATAEAAWLAIGQPLHLPVAPARS